MTLLEFFKRLETGLDLEEGVDLFAASREFQDILIKHAYLKSNGSHAHTAKLLSVQRTTLIERFRTEKNTRPIRRIKDELLDDA